MRCNLRTGLGIAGLTIVLDQLSKWWIMERVMRPEGVETTPFFTPLRVAVTPFFDLVMTWNRGVSFGIGNNDGPWNALLLSGLALAIVVVMLVWLRTATSPLIRVALGGIIGGALGNVIDRLRFGAVADFLDVHVLGYHWPAFNVADSAIFVGVALMLWHQFRFGKENE